MLLDADLVKMATLDCHTPLQIMVSVFFCAKSTNIVPSCILVGCMLFAVVCDCIAIMPSITLVHEK
jgi:hypothetical protein